MSSTTELRRMLARDGARGQILPLFAVGLFVLLLVAALVFDVGQVLFQRRAQQDAADAAALAGARWMVDGATNCKAAPSTANCSKAVAAARALAVKHGFSVDQVHISIPPVAPSKFAGARGHIMVTIDDTHQSWFAGIVGLFNMDISAMAVAANTNDYSLPYSLLALAPDCSDGSNSAIGGNGTVTVGGAIQVNATGCSSGSLTVGGGGTTALQVSASGCYLSDQDPYPGYKPNGGVAVDCGSGSVPVEGAPAVPDPLSELEVNLSTLSTAARPVVYADGAATATPNNWNCPGSPNAGTAAAPQKCKVSNLNTAAVTSVVLSPGIYWGGITVTTPPTGKTLNVYLKPGIYAFAGGGFSPDAGGGSGTYNLRTIATPAVGSTPPYATGGGVLLYNTDDPETCPNGLGGCIGAIKVTGGGGSLELLPYQFAPYKNLLIYQDRDASSQPDILLTGTGSITLKGTIYAPEAEVRLDGQGSGTSAQIIAYNFTVTGNGTLEVTYQSDGVYKIGGVGLVQ